MTSDQVLVETSGHIGTVTLNRPEAMNAINVGMTLQIQEALNAMEKDPDVWVVVITGTGKAFSTGHDLKNHDEVGPTPDILYDVVSHMETPIIAAINGYCIAGGAGIAMSCDVRVAASGAMLGWPHAKRGIMSVSGPALLSRSIPMNIAMEYMLTGTLMSAEEAGRWGLVNHVVESESLLEKSYELAGAIAMCSPLAVRAIKKAAVVGRDLDQFHAEEYARMFLPIVNESEDAKEGLRAFEEKREPVWVGR